MSVQSPFLLLRLTLAVMQYRMPRETDSIETSVLTPYKYHDSGPILESILV